jgi:hypothetical protein
MNSSSADAQSPHHPSNRPLEHEGEQRLENAPNLMRDLRGEAAEQGRDPEEVDPLAGDEDQLRRESSDSLSLKR